MMTSPYVSWTCFFCGTHMREGCLYVDGKQACPSCASKRVRKAINPRRSSKLPPQPEDSLALAIQSFIRKRAGEEG